MTTNTAEREWGLVPGRRLAKVTPVNVSASIATQQIGYVTLERALNGADTDELERRLGLLPFLLRGGATIHALTRLPRAGEFARKGNASQPGGEKFDDGYWERFKANRITAAERFGVDLGDPNRRYFPPGSPRVPQWQVLVTPREIPLTLVARLFIAQRFKCVVG